MKNMRGSRFAGANLQRRASPRKNVGKEAIDSLARINTSGRQLGQEKASFFLSLASYRRRTPTEFGPPVSRSIENIQPDGWIFSMVDQEGSILHTKSLKDRLKSIITEINEEVDYWHYLLEPAYNRYLASRGIVR